MDDRLETASSRALALISDRFYDEEKRFTTEIGLIGGWGERKRPQTQGNRVKLRLDLARLRVDHGGSSERRVLRKRIVGSHSPAKGLVSARTTTKAACPPPQPELRRLPHPSLRPAKRPFPPISLLKPRLFLAVPDEKAASPGPLVFLPFGSRRKKDSLYTEMEELTMAKRRQHIPKGLHCWQKSLTGLNRSQSSTRPGSSPLSANPSSTKRLALANPYSELTIERIDISEVKGEKQRGKSTPRLLAH